MIAKIQSSQNSLKMSYKDVKLYIAYETFVIYRIRSKISKITDDMDNL